MHQLAVVPFVSGHLPGAEEDAQSLALHQLIVNPADGSSKDGMETHLTCKHSRKGVDNCKIC